MRRLRGSLVVGGLLLATGPSGVGAASGASTPRVKPEVPVTAVDLRASPAQNSPSLVVDPTESRFVVLANRLDAPDFGCALQLSGDGGRSWVPAAPVPKLPAGAASCYAPEVAFDRSGTLYYLFVGLRKPGNVPMGAFLVTSTDRGRSFSAPRRILGANAFTVRMAIDGDSGRLHLVWLQASTTPPLGGFPAPPNPILAAFSDDGGNSFSKPVRVSAPDRPRAVAPALALAPGGSVHIAYYDLKNDAVDYQGLEGPTWDGTWALVISSSTDGGRHFGSSVVVDDEVVPPERVILIFTMAAPALAADGAGRLYVAWYDARNGDWDVFLRRSGDGGRSWAMPKRLNDDPVANGAHQYMPRLSVAPGGRVDAIFYDRRDDPENFDNHVFYTWSSDAGRSFRANLALTHQSFDNRIGQRYPIPSALGLVEFGSRLALVSDDRRAVAAWTDTRNAFGPPAVVGGPVDQDVFATEVDFPAAPRSPARSWPWAPGAALGAVVIGGLFWWRRRTPRNRGAGATPAGAS